MVTLALLAPGPSIDRFIHVYKTVDIAVKGEFTVKVIIKVIFVIEHLFYYT